jgi:two-component system cell cycle sensor histidine kinase/response regulator CckA
MKPAPLPPDEAGRLKSLQLYEVLDTLPEQAFDDLTLIAAQICQVPMAQVSFVDKDRVWLKSRIGMKVAEVSRDVAFCAHTILHADEVFELRDATLDARFVNGPLVTSGDKIRFYAGSPLVAPDGHALGALCVMDRNPRTLAPEQLAALRALSHQMVAQLELRRQARQMATGEQEARKLLLVAEKSRHALLSVLEDEKLTARSLRESEERFQEMANSIDEVFWMTDMAKNKILYVSPAYDRIWGRPCEELYASPQTWVAAIVPEDRARVLSAALAKQATGEYQEEYRIMRPDGTVRWIHDRAFPVKNAAGEVYRVAGVAVDITERKKLEEQFLHAQRMEAIGTLAAGVAHDLNNILGPMLMVAGLLKTKLPEASDQRLLGMVESGAQRGASVIRQLMLFSRGASGERIVVQVRHLIKDLAALLRETFPRDIAISENTPNDLWPVLGDATQLHQVMMNLCVNARDAMPSGGRLTIGAKNTELSEAEARSNLEAKAGRYLMIYVEDTGEGMSPELAKRVFDPFFTTKAVGKGTGLGLSTVLGIAKSHGGFVTLRSGPGQGTAVKVYLPMVSDPVGEEAHRHMSLPPFGNAELVLVVDDEAPIRDATCGILREHNYQVLAARDGIEALSLFLGHREVVRLVLTDIMMPNMDGAVLIRALRATAPKVAIVATTGLEQEGRNEELTNLGVAEILIKPCAPAELLAAVRRSLVRSIHG